MRVCAREKDTLRQSRDKRRRLVPSRTKLLRRRGAIPLAPWLQPGGQVLRDDSWNRFQRFREIVPQEKPLEAVPSQFPFANHRAEAAVLMRSLRFRLPAKASKQSSSPKPNRLAT